MSSTSPLYPLKFEPQLQKRIWGGSKLSELFEKGSDQNIGESWEISGVEGNISIVSSGKLKGRKITELIGEYKDLLVGNHVYEKFNDKFPLLFKFIDAKEDLSVQLHPDDELARQRHNSFGKTEMWYIMDADKDARLLLGFNREMDESRYLNYLTDNRIPEILNEVKVENGDSFYISPGTIHAIGAGVLLAEIQQTSDITYRIYDWDRVGLDGKKRELHTDLARKAINYDPADPRLTYSKRENQPNLICDSPFFMTRFLKLTGEYRSDRSEIDSFVVYLCVEGEGKISWEDGTEGIKKGSSLLVPACIRNISITGYVSLLEVYIP